MAMEVPTPHNPSSHAACHLHSSRHASDLHNYLPIPSQCTLTNLWAVLHARLGTFAEQLRLRSALLKGVWPASRS